MEVRRTMTMNWDELGELDDDDDLFFDAQRLSAVSPQDLASSSDEDDDDDDFDDSRSTFSAVASFRFAGGFPADGFDKWMASPESINDRRRKLLVGMGLDNDDAPSRQIDDMPPTNFDKPPESSPQRRWQTEQHHQHRRSRSDEGVDSSVKSRREEMIGSVSKEHLTRTLTGIRDIAGVTPEFMIKNVDKEKKLVGEEGNNDVQSGEHKTTEESHQVAGNSEKTKELSRKDSKNVAGNKLTSGNTSFKKSFKKSKKRGASFLKNIKCSMAVGSKSEKERGAPASAPPAINSNHPPSTGEQKTPSEWVKARVHGKPFKELTALHRSQEIHAHEGSIWAMKFTYDGHYLATAGEDKVIHIWEVQEFDVMSNRGGDDSSSMSGTPVHPMAMMASPSPSPGPEGRPPLPEGTPEKKKKGKKKKGIPDYVHVPESVFGLSETPFFTFKGHLDDILDLSWSRSQHLLSSSMDKTVRLWDMETKECLKVFSHSDYVTCIQFNPADDDYFISGSLDAKVRIWNIPDRHLVDWLDLHEMVTAVGFSNDGKVSVVGSHKGMVRYYNTSDYKLDFKEQIELKTKKKPHPKKITGFQFSAYNPSEVLVTSADSRVRILDGIKVVQKFKGYKNNNTQFAADYSPDGKYIISASEDSQVYIWRHEESKGKHKHSIISTSYEHFPCREVSVTAPWPGSSKLEAPLVAMHSKRHSKKSTTTLPSPITGMSPARDDGHGKRASSLPPLPKRSSNSSTESIEDAEQHSHTDSSVGPSESFSSAATGSSGRFEDVTTPSPSRNEGSHHGHKTIQATAWGLVIVAAGMGGEIKVYQNVGLPFKVGVGRL